MDVSTLLSNRVPLDFPSRHYRFYGMGWIRTELPGVMGLQGDNTDPFDVDELPVLGLNFPPKMAYYHQGSSIDYQSALYLFPESDSIVVVLTNSQPLNDAAHWISQLYVFALFNFTTPPDFVELVRESKTRKLAKFTEMQSSIDKIREQNPGDIPRPLNVYLGQYFNEHRNFFIEVRTQDKSQKRLELVFQGLETQIYQLRHLKGDSFEWALDYDESAKRGRFANWDPLYFEIEF